MALGHEPAWQDPCLGASILAGFGFSAPLLLCLTRQQTQFPLAGRNCSVQLALWERDSLGVYRTGLYPAQSSGRALWICSSPEYSCTQKSLTPQSFLAVQCLASRPQLMADDILPQHQLSLSLLRFCISRISDMPRCTVDVASAEKFLPWINALCVFLLLPGAKPGCAQRNGMGYF